MKDDHEIENYHRKQFDKCPNAMRIKIYTQPITDENKDLPSDLEALYHLLKTSNVRVAIDCLEGYPYFPKRTARERMNPAIFSESFKRIREELTREAQDKGEYEL